MTTAVDGTDVDLKTNVLTKLKSEPSVKTAFILCPVRNNGGATHAILGNAPIACPGAAAVRIAARGRKQRMLARKFKGPAPSTNKGKTS